MPSLCDLYINLSVMDAETVGTQGFRERRRWTPFANNGKRETVSLTGSAFTALSPPSGAKFVLIDVGTATSLVLKGITGDTGVAITPALAPLNIPVLLPLGPTPSIGILNSGATVTVEVVWL